MLNVDLRVYTPTTYKGLRFRLIGISNKYFHFDYVYNSVLDQARDILADLGYDNKIINISNHKDGYFIQIEA